MGYPHYYGWFRRTSHLEMDEGCHPGAYGQELVSGSQGFSFHLDEPAVEHVEHVAPAEPPEMKRPSSWTPRNEVMI